MFAIGVENPRRDGAAMARDGLTDYGRQASNLQVGCSIHPGRATRDGHFRVVGISSRPPTVPELCPECERSTWGGRWAERARGGVTYCGQGPPACSVFCDVPRRGPSV